MKTEEEIESKIIEINEEIDWWKAKYENGYIKGHELIENWDRLLTQRNILIWVTESEEE